MKTTKILAINAIYYSGLLSVLNFMDRGNGPLIIYYHEIFGPNDNVDWCNETSLLMPVALFAKQIEYFARKFSIVPLQEALRLGRRDIVSITFDDGYRGVYKNAFPIMSAMNVPATVFVATDYLASNSMPWWETFVWQLRQLEKCPTEGRSQLSRNLSAKWAPLVRSNNVVHVLLSAYKIATKEERGELGNALVNTFGTRPSWPDRLFISPSEIQEMQEKGFSFGSHTKSHPLLTWLDSTELFDELVGSRKVLQELTGNSDCWFAYPDGMFTQREETAVQDAGYVAAVQTFRNYSRSGRFAVPRVGLNVQRTTGATRAFSKAKTEWTLAALRERRFNTSANNRT